MKYFRSFLGSIFLRRGRFLALVIICWFIATLLVLRDKTLWPWLDPIVSLATLMTAILVWVGELYQDWEARLPRRLNTFLFMESRPILVCRFAYLAGEGDIRQWGQQIGAQMAGGRHLALDPLRIVQKRLGIRTVNGECVLVYQVMFHLKGDPTTAAGTPAPSADTCLLWADDPPIRIEERVPLSDPRVHPE